MAGKIKERTFSGTTDQTPQPYEAPHAQLARRAAAEGIVLLKNEDGLLPIAKGSKLALFGAGAGRTIKGGTGSGDVNERYTVSVLQGLQDAGYTITTEQWIADYEKQYEKARLDWKQEIQQEQAKLEEQGMMSAFFVAYSNHQFAMPAGDSVYGTEAETALYVISRIAGENADRFAKGNDYFLSAAEQKQIAKLCRLYQNVVVLVNAGGVVDLSFLDEFPAVKGVLMVSQPGMEGGHAIADVVSGAVNPSGKLTDTWAFRYEDYPNAATFSHNNGNVEKELYEEGIYVGYRYFDSFQLPVRYGFGFGLSYTTFALETKEISAAADGTVAIRVTVTNTGSAAGREVVQVYAGLPEGRLEKEVRRLTAFAKTALLAPGESQELTLTFGAVQLESYDEAAASWILEKGAYGIYVGNSLESSQLAASLVLESDKMLTQTEHICPLQQTCKTLSLPQEKRAAHDRKMQEEAAAVQTIAYDLSAVPSRIVDYSIVEPEDEASRLVDGLTTDQLVYLATGEPSKGQGADSSAESGNALGSAGASVPGSAAETSNAALEEGVANIVLADGPAGLRLTQTYYVRDGKPQAVPIEMNMEHGIFYDGEEPKGEKYYQYCTAIPVGTMLAQTWDMPLLEEIGAMVGEEMKAFGVQLWLAPGMNIHRNPLCGRNFEYFAEDPLLSGKCAAAVTNGVQSHPGIGTTIKHFACNNQEDNRMASDSILTERTLREIYLKGFEIAVQEAQPMSIMTSYNLINGVHTANNYDLCVKAARCEFGFDGVIMTDWTTTNVDEKCTAAGCMRAGNDLVMPGTAMDHKSIREALADGSLTTEQLKWCVTHVVRTVLRSDCYEN
ncbi:MAG: glycoside hydrolase family 3 C-terminal domain-containing protein [Blautia sp.]|nr:glycoside hydrolase family 3 C-terminal domain-containing protein [Blautia sp.]MCM1199989.1 glycoside hydrolase family 3 C-terminal domain-containing protein [Bacteroides fragilis]